MIFNNSNYSLRHNDAILPTFTCATSDGNILRGLKDCGSQSNLVAKSVLTPGNHRVIENIKLDLSGINESKIYRTKLIEMNIKLGDKYISIEAIVLPSVQINLDLPGLSKVVEHFKSKGYKLSDENLFNYKDKIDGIELLLGTDASYCFIDRMIPFGKSKKSIFSCSNLGVMLYGKIDQILKDIDDLPLYSKIKENESNVKLKSSVNLTSVQISNKLSSCNRVGGANFQLNNSDSLDESAKTLIDKAVSQTLE